MWHPAAHPTPEQVARAYALLAQWSEGAVWTEGDVQYRAAWHPNHNGPGQHHGIEVWINDDSPAPYAAPARKSPAPSPGGAAKLGWALAGVLALVGVVLVKAGR